MTTLAVIPSDPMSAYEAVGCHVWAEAYYNPGNAFDKVFLFSPLEKEAKFQYGMETIPTKPGQLPGRIRENAVDIVRAYGGYWACDMACKNKVKGIPVVVSVHDTNPDELYNSVAKADYVFCMSRAVRELVLTKFPHEERVWILPNRYDARVMRPMPEEDFSDLDAEYPWKYKLLCVGRLAEQKNQDNLIRALKILGPDYGCIFVGRNDPSELQKLANEEGVADQCRFVESIRNDLLPRYYNWCDAMVTPSRWEGFGIVFIEALASGAIVVTSNVGPMNEYITHEKNGLLVDDYENPKALAEMTIRACTDDELRERLRENAPGSVSRFEKERVDALEAGYYHRILAETRDHAAQAGILRTIKRKLTRTEPVPLHDIPAEEKCARRALKWLHYHSLEQGGIVHSPQAPRVYPEVTGYCIPTLLEAGENSLALQYGQRLLELQNSDGSWNGFDCEEAYTFDVGQILKGLMTIYLKRDNLPGKLDDAIYVKALHRGCNWLMSQIAPDGRITTPDKHALDIPGRGEVPEAFYLYTLRPLIDAARDFSKPEYEDAARRAIAFYKQDENLGSFNTLSHFHAYIVEALIDLEETDLARRAMEKIAEFQNAAGAVPAWPDAQWVCSTGLAQYALCWLKLGEAERAHQAYLWLCSRQNLSGGFYGSYGKDAEYFPKSEISWAVKYFLDVFYFLRRDEANRIQMPALKNG
ncbi:MAG: glycosyltransferase [Candidatus Sumerlaeia bacterium]